MPYFLLVAAAGVSGLCVVVWRLARPRRPEAKVASSAPPALEPRVADPYRESARHEGEHEAAEPDPDAELALLAARGQQRVRDESVRGGDERAKHIEWTRLYRLCDAMRLLPSAPRTHVSEAVPAEVQFPPAQFDPGNDDRVGPPLRGDIHAATRKAHGESAWLASLPFALERYFAVLAEQPLDQFRLVFTIALSDPSHVPSPDIVQGVVHLHDVSALVAVSPEAVWPITIRSSPISGSSGMGPSTNERMAPYIHGLIDKVLLPLHRSRSIARVSLASCGEPYS